jgi:hypothetical protein
MITKRILPFLSLAALALFLVSPMHVARSATASLTILSPNGGEALKTGTSVPISWKTSANGSYAFSYFLIPQGDTPTLPSPPPGGSSIAFLEDYGGYSVGGKSIAIATSKNAATIFLDADLPAGDYTLKIYASKSELLSKPSEAAFSDESDKPFSVKSAKPSAGSLRIISPDEGDVWTLGIPQLVRFESKDVGSVQIALQNLSTGQPCTIATNVSTSRPAWMYIPVAGARCIGTASESLVPGTYKIALYDTDWGRTHVSAYSKEPLVIEKAAWKNDIERLTAMIEALTEVLVTLRKR